MKSIYSYGLSLLIACIPASSVGQQSAQPATPNSNLGSGEVISTARIADPNELVGINGRIVKMSDLTSLLSSLDSLKGLSLHIPATQNDGMSLPALPPTSQDSKCLVGEQLAAAKRAGQADPCPPIQSARQAQSTKPQQE